MPLGFGSTSGATAFKGFGRTRRRILTPTTQAFTYTGSDQTFTVPTEVTEIQFKLWGAGGGIRHGNGGAGGFSEAKMSVSPGETLTIVVGSAGASVGGPAYGGGGVSYPDDGRGGSAGGGRSSIRSPGPGLDLITAGGGGGSGWPGGYTGGGGGGLTGRPGAGGGGGTQTAGGGGHCGDGGCGGTGTQHSGGPGTGGWAGGGGGGGWWGGGGSSGVPENHYSGGGGSGFVGRNGSSAIPGNEIGSPSTYGDTTPRSDTVNGRTYSYTKCLRGASGSTTAINNGDTNYAPGVGGAGQNGRVVLIYDAVSYE